jgi:tRNA (mo5U34)-methyltransferase
MDAQSVRLARGRRDSADRLAEKGWFHSFELPGGAHIDGCISLEALRERYARFPIPEDLRGKHVLDIGAWDGWFSFEAERRGASVTAIDCVDLASFRQIHRTLRSQAAYRTFDLYDLPEAGLGKFDIVFFLGVLYHIKHPLLGLEIVCGLTDDVALVDSFVTDGNTWQEHGEDIPSLEFYETDELAGQLDNWFGPSVACLLAMCRAAGFARVQLLHAAENSASVACYRRWEPVPAGSVRPAPTLIAATNNADGGANFAARRDQYLACWFESEREDLRREDLCLEVEGYGAQPVHVRRAAPSRWQANFRLPPGLQPGWKLVRLRFADTPFGNSLRIAVDLPLEAGELALRDVCDGQSWVRGEVTAGGVLSFWVAGLGENCDRNNIHVYLGEVRLPVDHAGAPEAGGYRQVNAAVPGEIEPGEYRLVVTFGPSRVEHDSKVQINR